MKVENERIRAKIRERLETIEQTKKSQKKGLMKALKASQEVVEMLKKLDLQIEIPLKLHTYALGQLVVKNHGMNEGTSRSPS